ncbi:ATP-binding protein [uncultured Bacteroides sp.]|uniref:ATP-binding protein n=1 Tax=uncultured Bacteroides sp. TaxID=162156 RepID=UPI002610BA77|nr:ATP-binding protein [uncultured Bacteroides sp.]
MRHIIIRNLGPLADADVFLNKINIIVGPQSAGKSCLLKTACFCDWVEKRIQLSQKPDAFKENGVFENKFVEFHKLHGYIKEDSYIEYENDSMKFSYSWKTKAFDFSWKEEGRWNYVCPKISYIPAERNIVAAIPNWFEVSMKNDNIRNFMKDWQEARSIMTEEMPILNLGVSYRYDKSNNMDKVTVGDGVVLDFTNTSSGLQSLIPLLVHLEFLYKKRFDSEQSKNVTRILEEEILRSNIFNEMSNRALKGGKNLFHLHDNDKIAESIFRNFTSMKVTEIFLEEPEQNLFPPTQGVLAYRLIDWARGERGGFLFIATHSPYMVTSFLERDNMKDISLFFNKEAENGKYIVRTATEKEVQELYDYSIDVFHNLESLG